jgi:hypothetical protein
MIRRLQTYAWDGRHLLHGLFDLSGGHLSA